MIDPAPLVALLPTEAHGYRPDGRDELYGPDSLFELLDGGAEVYRSLNVRAVLSRIYAKPGAPDVLADLFDMGTAPDAYGAYHHDMREGPGAGLGQESEDAGSSLFFWKDRYFASVVATSSDSASRQAALAIARTVDGRIDREGPMPDLVARLPSRALVASQIHYFHTWPLLTRYYPFAGDNLLELDGETEGIVARYRSSGERRPAMLLIVRYPSSERAADAHRRFLQAHLPGMDTEIADRDEGWVGFVRRDRELLGVFDAADREQVLSLIAEVERRSRSTT